MLTSISMQSRQPPSRRRPLGAEGLAQLLGRRLIIDVEHAKQHAMRWP
jgi:hypothetical protein